MALPTGLVAGSLGHIGHHNTIHAALNAVVAPFGIAPIRVEDFEANWAALTRRRGQLLAAVDTGAFAWDDGIDLHEAGGGGPAASLLWGENIMDHGAIGDGVNDDRAAIDAAATAAIASGSRTIIFPTAPVNWVISSPLNPTSYGGYTTWIGLGGNSGVFPAFDFNRVQIFCGSGAVFEPTDPGTPGSVCTIENIAALNCTLFHNKPINSTGSPYGDALFRIINCGSQAQARGSYDDAAIVIEKAFWVWIEKCSLQGPIVNTTTTSSTTLSTSPFTMNVASTTGMPPSGSVLIGAINGGAARVVHYGGKTGTTLTGCTTVDTGTFSSGTAVKYWGPPVIARTGGPTYGAGITYLITMKENILSGGGLRFEMLDDEGGAIYANGELLLDDCTVENSYHGVVDVINTHTTGLALKNVTVRNSYFHDNAAPSSGFGANAVFRTRGAQEVDVYNLQIHNCDQNGPYYSIYMADAASAVRGHVSGIQNAVEPFEPGSTGNADHLIVENRTSCTIYNGPVSGPQKGWWIPNGGALYSADTAGAGGELINFWSDNNVYLGTYSGTLNRDMIVRTNGQEFLHLKDDAGTRKIGFNGATPVAKGTITGSRGGNAALASLLTYLASRGDIVDSTS